MAKQDCADALQGPEWHPNDVGQIKLASHLMQYITMKFGWHLYGTGDEVESGK